jgi:hypothetical protein
MAKRDLTMWEVDEAKKYGLSPDQYDELKSLLNERYRKTKWETSLEQARTEAVKNAKPKLKEEVKAEILADLTSKFEAGKIEEIRKRLEKEMAEAAPTVNQRRDAKEMAHELELDCLATAHAASADADGEDAVLATDKFRNGIFYSLLLSFLPVLAYLHMGVGWTFSNISFWAIAITHLAAIFICGDSNSTWRSEHKKKKELYKKASVDYWNLANKAKEVRMVKINNANTKGEIVNLLSEISYAKNNYGEKYQPSTKLLEKSKDHVRNNQINDMDLDRFIRSDDDRVRVNNDPLDDSEEFEESLKKVANGS